MHNLHQRFFKVSSTLSLLQSSAVRNFGKKRRNSLYSSSLKSHSFFLLSVWILSFLQFSKKTTNANTIAILHQQTPLASNSRHNNEINLLMRLPKGTLSISRGSQVIILLEVEVAVAESLLRSRLFCTEINLWEFSETCFFVKHR